jgi:hypothetical protein
VAPAVLDFRHGAPAAGRWNGSGSANRPAPPGYRLYVLRPEAMIINALFFASYRDIAGTDELRVELPGDSRVDDLVHLLRAVRRRLGGAACGARGRGQPGLRAAQHALCGTATRSPSSRPWPGGEMTASICRVTEDPIDPAALLTGAATPSDGAVLLFLGVVRDHNEGRDVGHLEYQAYVPMAERLMREIVEEAIGAVVHRADLVCTGWGSGDRGGERRHRGRRAAPGRCVRGVELRDRRDQEAGTRLEAGGLPRRGEPVAAPGAHAGRRGRSGAE